MSRHTPGPWLVNFRTDGSSYISMGNSLTGQHKQFDLMLVAGEANDEADAILIAAAPTQHAEMLRYLPILERAEADAELWGRLTAGTGIATANGYRNAIAKAAGELK